MRFPNGSENMFKFISFILAIGFMVVCGSMNLLAAEINNTETHQFSQESAFAKNYLKSTQVEPKNQTDVRSPLSLRNITNEIVSGTVGGLCVGYYLSFAREDIGYFTDILGSSSGVQRAGNMGDETGSFWATLGGSISGGILGVGIIFIINRYDLMSENVRSKVGIASFLSFPVIGATIGFNLTRRYKLSSAPN